MLRRLVPLAAVVALALFGPAMARAAAPFKPCRGYADGVLCATIPAPLDYTGAVAGVLPLAVEVAPAKSPRGVMLLVAGGPGQPSAAVFGLADAADVWRDYFPGYTLASYDDRGTGASGPLWCPSTDTYSVDMDFDTVAALVGACGADLGPNRVFYSTRDHAEDIETVRKALGVEKIAIWGTSYGTKQAVAYALAHPDHVERLLLDSALPVEGPDLYATDMLRGLQAGLASLCDGTLCRGVSNDLGDEVAALANRLAAAPVIRTVAAPQSTTRVVRLDGMAVLSLAIESDLNPGLAAELPAAVNAALVGRVEPLVRLFALATYGDAVTSGAFFNTPLQLATTCNDGVFPWRADAGAAERRAALDAAIAALPQGALGPFGSWAALFGTAGLCLAWPSPTGAALAAGPLPDVPVLVLSGDRDIRTPTAGARELAARFPTAKVLVVPGVGHSVLTSDYSLCVRRAVALWLNDQAITQQCERQRPLFAPIGRFLASFSEAATTKGLRGGRGRTLTAVVQTLRDAEAAWLTSFGRAPVDGLASGRAVAARGSGIKLVRFSDVPGVEVSGTLRLDVERLLDDGSAEYWQGKIKVSGSRAAHGTLFVEGEELSGHLGRKFVELRR